MLICPVCGSEDVRRSRKKTLLALINRWRGLQRYRCRDCAKSFYRPLSAADRSLSERSAGDGAQESRDRTRSERNAGRKKGRRRKIELVVFFGMLVIFYAALKVFTHSS